MSRVRVECFTISLDGYGAGPNQNLEHPLGGGGEALHEWLVSTRSWRQLHGKEGGDTGVDEAFATRAHRGVGAWIMGRNMFGPVRGDWPDASWRGWWGDDPPFHGPVFVLTHHARPSVKMEGGTVFHFITGSIHEALDQARQAAGDKDVQISGGAGTIRQYLHGGLIDELHIAIAPILLGSGAHLFEDIDLPASGYERAQFTPSEKACHVVLRRRVQQPQGL